MINVLTAADFTEKIFDSGLLTKDLSLTGATDYTTLLAALQAAVTDGTSLLGATTGGVNFSDTPEYYDPETDGKFQPIKGDKHIINRTVKIAGTLKRLSMQNLKDIIVAADLATASNIETLTPRADIDDDDYIDELQWFGFKEDNSAIVVITLSNALQTAGAALAAPNKADASIPFEFTAHAAQATSTTVPYTIKEYTPAA